MPLVFEARHFEGIQEGVDKVKLQSSEQKNSAQQTCAFPLIRQNTGGQAASGTRKLTYNSD